MARSKFGGTSDDYVFYTVPFGVNQVVSLGSSVTLTFWNAPTGGTRYTDLLLNGSPVTSITTSGGWVPEFQGPDGITEMYADSGATTRGVLFAQGQQGPTGPAGPSIAAWAAATAYTAGQVASVGTVLYQSNDNHTSAGTWAADSSHWTAIGPVASVVGQSGAVTGSQIAADPALLGTYAAKNVPAYAGSRAGIFDGHSGYNQTATNMTRWRALLGTIMAGGGGDIGFIGDSLTAGSTTSGGTYQVTKAWPSFFRQLLQNVLPAGSCQDGFIRAVSTPTLADTRWSATGTWTDGTSFVYSTAVNSTDMLTTTNTGVNISVWYYDWNDGSTFSITPGGGSATTVTCSGPQGPKRKDILGVTATSTVTIKHLTGTYMGLIGAAIWNPNTLLFHNLAQGGSTATGTGTGSWTDTVATNSPWTIYVAPHNVALNTSGQNDPQVMFHCLGANDMKTQTAAATKTAVQSIISAYSNSDNIPVAMQPLNTTYFSDATWTSWVSTVYDLAESLGNVGIDVRNIVGNYASCTAQTFTVDGQGHFQPFANALLARSIAKALRV